MGEVHLHTATGPSDHTLKTILLNNDLCEELKVGWIRQIRYCKNTEISEN